MTKRSNESYFEETLLPLYDQIYRMIFAAVGNVHDAQDLTQQVFEKAWNRLWQLRDRTKGPAWLRSIARNQVRLFFKERKRIRSRLPKEKEKNSEDKEKKWETPNLNSDLSDILVRMERFRNLETALWSLDERYRMIFAQHILLGIPIKDIARNMGVNENTARSWLYRARKQIRDIVKKLEEGGDGDA